MGKEYEFSYQSPKQKAVLGAFKAVVALLTAFALYRLGWVESGDPEDKFNALGTALVGFWAYANLLRVKTEIQELFVPPADIEYAKEFMIAGFVMYMIALVLMFAG